MMIWTDIKLYTFRQDGRNVFVVARSLDEAREVAGITTRHYDLVRCDLHMTEWMFTQRQDVNSGLDP